MKPQMKIAPTAAYSGQGECVYCESVLRADSPKEIWNEELSISEGDVSVVPTRGMLVQGWLLAIPREHVLSIRSLDLSRSRSFWSVTARAAALVEQAFGPATLFEHGASRPGSAVGCGVDHAHLHIVPLMFDLISAARGHPLGRRLEWHRVTREPYSGLSDAEPYLFVQSPVGDKWVATGAIPSQFFRRVIANELGHPGKFDWRCDDGLALVSDTRQALARLGEV